MKTQHHTWSIGLMALIAVALMFSSTGVSAQTDSTQTLANVQFSHQGGFYSAGFTLTLTHEDPEAIIIFTIDGSEPDTSKLGGHTFRYKNQYRQQFNQSDGPLLNATYISQIYESGNPIQISDRTNLPNTVSMKSSTFDFSPSYFPTYNIPKGTVVRARAFSGNASSPVSSNTYFIFAGGRSAITIPVVSISIQEDYLFDYTIGIYNAGIDFDTWRQNSFAGPDGSTPANYRRRGEQWEYPAHFELFEPGEESPALSQQIGVRIHGGWSRSDPFKTLRLYARSDYGTSRFRHQMFPDQPDNNYNRLLLRNSGNDRGTTMFRDAAIHAVVGHMNFDTQAYRPAVVFINGEYWGIHNFRERLDHHYLARVYGVESDKVDILEANGSVVEGDNQHYRSMVTFIRNNSPASQANFDSLKTMMDVDNFMDYHIAQIYVSNLDWPGNNIDFWRYQTDGFQPDAPYGHDGRWRWMMYDTDFGFGLYSSNPPQYNSLAAALATNGPSWPNPEWSTILLRRLLLNTSFRDDFINRFADQLNTAFQPERVQTIIDAMADLIEPEMPEHSRRWRSPSNVTNWRNEVNRMKNWVDERPIHMRTHIRQQFNLPGTAAVTLNVNDPRAGTIKINSIDITSSTPGVAENPYPWNGLYFRGIPIRLTAKPVAGYTFSHWSGGIADSTNQSVLVDLSASRTFVAHFVVDDNPDVFPVAHPLSNAHYEFSYWSSSATAGSYPDNMVFVYMDQLDPGLSAEVSGFTTGTYDLTSRTRINGLDEDGFSFVNTGNESGNPGYPGIKLGGAILALNTMDTERIYVEWDGMTVHPNSRVYHLRLQYRIGNQVPFQDVLNDDGEPVEYMRNEASHHRETIGPVRLPQELTGIPYIQLMWRYYYTGEQLDPESGQRSELAIPHIRIIADADPVSIDQSRSSLPGTMSLDQNYPNPFNPVTTIRFSIPESSQVSLEIFSITGRKVATLVENQWFGSGQHELRFNASNIASGLYIYRLTANEYSLNRSMLLIK